MENAAKENERNIFEEYLMAYLREYPEAREYPFPQMSGIRGIYGDKSRGLSILYNCNMEREQLGTAYFKVYDHAEIDFAERVVELHFKDGGMEYHVDPYGKKPWILNEKDVKRIQDFLKEDENDYSCDYDGYWYTNWKALCYQWNSDNGLFSGWITDYRMSKYDDIHKDDSRLKNAYIPYRQKMPDTWNYDPPKAHAEFHECRPVFREGDVVSVTENNAYPDGLYVVREVVMIDIGAATEYVYDVSPVESDEEVYTFGKSFLEFIYHDSVWEKYFADSPQYSLPEWRGEPYNVKAFSYSGYYDCYDEERNHNNDTIPLAYMGHILERHSVYKRIDVVFASREDAKEMREKLNISSKDLYKLRRSITEKIDRLETNEAEPDLKKETGQKIRFTDLELALVSEIGRRDILNGEYNEHFPVQMTNLQIMRAVKEAYHAAYKISPRKLQRVCDKRDTDRYGLAKVISPVKGRILYEGISKNGLVIRFWYNFDLDLIETAYPVRMNNVKKNDA